MRNTGATSMAVLNFYDALTSRLRVSGDYIWPLALRLILAWEFWDSGVAKLYGDNWFADIPWADWQKGFPFPFDQIPVNLNWFLATWSELVFALMLLFGLLTRFSAISLIVVTSVATAAVHWPAEWNGLAELWSGYVITPKGSGNFKLPLLFVIMLLPLVFHGGGKFSLDHLLVTFSGRNDQPDKHIDGLKSTGLALLVLGLATIWVEPVWGFSLLISSVLVMLIPAITGKP
jgi:putative oxidoreductase